MEEQREKSKEKRPLTVLFIGENGAGKSSTINSIINDIKRKFDAGETLTLGETITKDVQSCKITFLNQEIELIDTPSFTNLEQNTKFKKLSKQGFDVIALVIPIKRLTPERLVFLEKVERIFKNYINRGRLLIVFTFGKELGEENITEFIKTGNFKFNELLAKANYTVFENNSTDSNKCEQQRESFFEMVDKIANIVGESNRDLSKPAGLVDKPIRDYPILLPPVRKSKSGLVDSYHLEDLPAVDELKKEILTEEKKSGRHRISPKKQSLMVDKSGPRFSTHLPESDKARLGDTNPLPAINKTKPVLMDSCFPIEKSEKRTLTKEEESRLYEKENFTKEKEPVLDKIPLKMDYRRKKKVLFGLVCGVTCISVLTFVILWTNK